MKVGIFFTSPKWDSFLYIILCDQSFNWHFTYLNAFFSWVRTQNLYTRILYLNPKHVCKQKMKNAYVILERSLRENTLQNGKPWAINNSCFKKVWIIDQICANPAADCTVSCQVDTGPVPPLTRVIHLCFHMGEQLHPTPL